MPQLNRGFTQLVGTGGVGIPNIDRYFGEVLNFTPTQNNSNISIDLKRVVFGAKFIVENLTNGRVEISIGDLKTTIIDKNHPTKTYQDIYTFSNYTPGYNSNKTWVDDDYTENIGVIIDWVNDNGITVNIAKPTITFKRKTLTTITIKMANGSSGSSSSGLSINMEPASPFNDGGNINIEQ